MKVAFCFLIAAVSSLTGYEATTTFDNTPLVYNFYDVLAQASCAAKVTEAKRVWAMRRSCTGRGTCHQICNRHGLKCVHTYHVYKNPNILALNIKGQPDEGVHGLSMYSYDDGCSWRAGHCGPNYCCCVGT